MTSVTSRGFATTAVLSFALVEVHAIAAQGTPPAAVTATQATAIDSFVGQTMRLRRIPGVAIAVVQDGNVVYRKAFGLSNLETKTALTVNGVFELASVTKQFTAGAIMLLVQEGKIDLDKAVTNYIDNAPGSWSPITVRHLLTHTSGIFAGGIVQAQGSPLLSVTRQQAFQHAAAARVFPTGSVGFYSDAGYLMLGLIIEKASGGTYQDFMQKRIFEPLGMTSTSLTDRRRVIEGRVSTYEIAQGALVNWRRDWDYELPSFFGIWSTLDDVAKWDTSIRRRTLLTQASLDLMWTPGKLNDGRDALVDGRPYGFGFRIGDLRGHRVVSHTGASGTLLLHLLEEPLSVIVLTNLSNTAGRHGTILGNGIVGLLRGSYTPVSQLAPQKDPNPRLAAELRTLLVELAADRVSPAMTAAHATYFQELPPIARTPLRAQLHGLGSLEFVVCDEVEGNGIRYTDPIARICHYRTTMEGQRMYLTFWLTTEGKAAHMRFSREEDF